MDAVYACRNSGSRLTKEVPTVNFENTGSLPNSFVPEISFDSPYPDISDLIPVHPEHDSGIYDMEPADAQASEAQGIKLAEWQEGMLRLWAAQHRRAASDREMLFFHGLLEVSEDVIKARLGQLFEEHESLSCVTGRGGLAQDSHRCFGDDTQAITKSFGTDTGTYGSPIIFQNENNVQNISQSFHQHVPVIGSTMHCFGALQPSQLQVLSNDYTSSIMTGTSSNVYNINDIFNDVNIHLSVHDLDYQVGSVTHPSKYEQPSRLLAVTQPLLVLIQAIANDRITQGCGRIRSHEIQTGKYPCTLGCERRFKTSCDLFRHEAIVYPQAWYFCFICGDVDNPLEKYLFTREDKLRHHCRDHHSNNTGVGMYRVFNAPSTFPERCTLCSHYRCRNWKDRCKHIIWHCKRGDDFANASQETKAKRVDEHQISSGDDDDDDEDDESNNDSEKNKGDRSDPPDPKDEPSADDFGSDDFQREGDEDQGPDASGQADYFTDIFDWETFNSSTFPNTISLTRLATEAQPVERSSEHLEIQWLDRVNKKGGTASVFKVALSTGLSTGRRGETRWYAVKQYSVKHRACYDREVAALKKLLVENVYSLHIIHCYGIFEYLDHRGQTTLNLLLEYAESDLREYFADTPRPRTIDEVYNFWESILGIARALQFVQSNPKSKRKPVYSAHLDLKPDNILIVNGTFKLADFGFSSFSVESLGSQVQGGTTTYGAPELQLSLTSHINCLVTPASDIWSFGCILSEAATWALLGFQGLRSYENDFRATLTDTNARTDPCFHNGQNLKPEILVWHNYLQSLSHENDCITTKVVDLVDAHLLQDDPALRLTATELVDALTQILSGARCKTHMTSSFQQNQTKGRPRQDCTQKPTGSFVSISPPNMCTSPPHISTWQHRSVNRNYGNVHEVKYKRAPLSTSLATVWIRQYLMCYPRSPAIPSSYLDSQFPNISAPNLHKRENCSATSSRSFLVTSIRGETSACFSGSTLPNDGEIWKHDDPEGLVIHHSAIENPSLCQTSQGYCVSFMSLRASHRDLAWFSSPRLDPASEAVKIKNHMQPHSDSTHFIQSSIARSHRQHLVGVGAQFDALPYKSPTSTSNSVSVTQSPSHDWRAPRSIFIIDEISDPHRLELFDRLRQEMDQFLSGRQERKTNIYVVTDWEWTESEMMKLRFLLSKFWHSKRRRLQRNRFQIHFSYTDYGWHHDTILRGLVNMFPEFVAVGTTPPSLADTLRPEGYSHLKRSKRIQNSPKVSGEVKSSNPEIIIAVMGVTGAGKSYFIKKFTQGSVAGDKQQIHLARTLSTFRSAHDNYVSVIPVNFDNKRVWLIDTPGFDDTSHFSGDDLSINHRKLHLELFADGWIHQHGHPQNHTHRNDLNRHDQCGRVSKRRSCTIGNKDRNGRVSKGLKHQHIHLWICCNCGDGPSGHNGNSDRAPNCGHPPLGN